MIDPANITNYNRSYAELQEFWLFCILVAGKTSTWAAKKTEELKNGIGIEYLFDCSEVSAQFACESYSTGQHKRIGGAIAASGHLDLRVCSFEELMCVKGVGPKTASFFLTHSRKHFDLPILDTHILKYLRSKGHDAPKQTPQSSNKYTKWGLVFREESEKDYPNMDLAERDLTIWKKYANI